MIKIADIPALLRETGLPFVYHDFRSNKGDMPDYPYVVWYSKNSKNFGADNVVFCENNGVMIELYSEIKDLNTEKLIKDALTKAGIFYETSETDLEEDSVHIVYFSISLLG